MNTVEAVKNKTDIELIHRKLNMNGGDLLSDSWKIGLNFALRISDLLALRYDQLESDSFIINEGKTGKLREIRINSEARKVIDRRRKNYPTHIFLFQGTGNRVAGRDKPVNRSYISRQFSAVGDELGLNINTHTMRKTRGHAMYQAGVRIEVISKMLNHSTTRETLKYIGIEKADIAQTYDDFVL